MSRQRLDKVLVARSLCSTRSEAQGRILAGDVLVDGRPVDKAGTMIDPDVPIRLRGEACPYVSRGGLKLRGALDAFSSLDVAGRVALDAGASTGGFTDCLLQAGVARVHAVDVGRGLLAWSLVTDPRVIVHDRTNIRTLTPEQLGERVDLVVGDLAFVSLTKVLPNLLVLCREHADLVVLVKPQFEVGRAEVGKGGIVRDPAARDRAVATVRSAGEDLGLRTVDVRESVVPGRDGNLEIFVWFAR
jgi:23S rRNA (cytidine1920-2'-O)/16S rRNA (cytidine1409-2'-O)-methyltransferase